MKKALLYRWFGIGKFPAIYATDLVAEGVLLSDDGLKGSVTYRNFHRPGMSAGYRYVGGIMSIVVTNMRVSAYNGENTLINVPFTDERLSKVAFSVETSGALLAAFDASLFHDDWSGQIEYRFKTPMAQEIVEKIKANLY